MKVCLIDFFRLGEKSENLSVSGSSYGHAQLNICMPG